MSRTEIGWVYHVGPGKTGTTFLQEQVFAAHDGIYCLGRPNHHTPAYRTFWEAVSRTEE